MQEREKPSTAPVSDIDPNVTSRVSQLATVEMMNDKRGEIFGWMLLLQLDILNT